MHICVAVVAYFLMQYLNMYDVCTVSNCNVLSENTTNYVLYLYNIYIFKNQTYCSYILFAGLSMN